MKKVIKTLKRDNSKDGRKAHNDNRYIKVGRVRMNSWINKVLPAADIIISERELVHIGNKHNKELVALGFDSMSYVQAIIQSCQEVYEDNKSHAYLFVLRQTPIHPMAHCAIIEMELAWMEQKRVYKIKTARPEYWSRLSQNNLLCTKAAIK